MTEKVRKSNLLLNEVIETREQLKSVHHDYMESINDLALVIKKELKSTVDSLLNGKSEVMTTTVVEKVEDILFELSGAQAEFDEIIRNIDGWEISVGASHDRIVEILGDQRDLNNQLSKNVNSLKTDLVTYKENPDEQLKEMIQNDIEDILVNFSRLQDYVKEAIPKISKLFEEFNEEIKISAKLAKNRYV